MPGVCETGGLIGVLLERTQEDSSNQSFKMFNIWLGVIENTANANKLAIDWMDLLV